jgi:hypothetical protein
MMLNSSNYAGVGNLNEEGAGARDLHKCLNFFLAPLIGGSGSDTDNLSFLLKILATIRTRYACLLTWHCLALFTALLAYEFGVL